MIHALLQLKVQSRLLSRRFDDTFEPLPNDTRVTTISKREPSGPGRPSRTNPVKAEIDDRKPDADSEIGNVFGL